MMDKITGHKKPFFSIITAVYNAGDDLLDTINSLKQQTCIDFEYIVIDGGSDNGTLDIIKKHRVNINDWISESDTGIYDAWNKGLELKKGEWVMFLGAGDCLYPDTLAAYKKYINETGCNLEFVSSKVKLINKIYGYERIVGKSWTWREFRKSMCTAHVASLHHESLFGKYGNFNEGYKIAGDYELLLRAKENLRAGYLDKVTAIMEIGGVSNSLGVYGESYIAQITSGDVNFLLAYYYKIKGEVKFLLRKVFLKSYR